MQIRDFRRPYQPGPTGRAAYQEPVRAPGVSSDVAVPLLQAILSGLFVAVVVLVLFGLGAWRWAGSLMLVATAIVWVYFLREHRQAMWLREWVDNAEPEIAPVVRTVIRVAVDGRPEMETPLEVYPDVLRKIARGVVRANRAFSSREWAGRGRLLAGRSEFDHIRDVFITRGWLRWKDPDNRQQGVEWTQAGWSVMQQIADDNLLEGDAV